MTWPPWGVRGIDQVSLRATALFGREGDLDRVVDEIAHHSLVCLLGPGGVGKTRLALEVASRLRAKFADGVSLVSFAGIDDSTQVPSAAAGLMRVTLGQNETVTDAIVGSLRSQHRLLVLDNCEHVLAGAADLCVAVGASCPDVRILATSRERLDLPHEAVYPVMPLAVPAADESVASGWQTPSVRMFAERLDLLRGVASESSSPEEQARICRIVRLLDGLPLAIELTAAQLDVCDLVEVEDRLMSGGSTPGLWAGPRKSRRGGRHATLESCMRWSYEHLSLDEQLAFRRLAMFSGHFSLAAARAAGVPEALVTALVRKSLVTTPQRDADGTLRYGLLRTVTAFAAELGASADLEQTWSLLADWFAAEAERVALGFESSTTELTALAWFDAEQDNLRATLGWAERNDPPTALRLVVASAYWTFVRGHYPEARSRLARLVAPFLRSRVHPGSRPESHVLSTALVWLSWFALFVSDFDECKRLHRELDARQGVEPRLIVDSLNSFAGALLNTGEHSAAEAAAREALSRSSTVGYPSGEAFAGVVLSVARQYRDDGPGALKWASTAMTVDGRQITGWVRRWTLVALSDAMQVTGDDAGAARVYRELLEQCTAAGDVHLAATAAVRLGGLEVRAGQRAGRAHLRLALRAFAAIRDTLMVCEVLEASAYYGTGIGHPRAPALIGAREALKRRIGSPDHPNDSDAKVRQELLDHSIQSHGAPHVSAELRLGATLDFDAACELAEAVLASEPPTRSADGRRRLMLSPRERELLQLVAAGRTDAQIAAELFISIRTVRSHLDRIGEKTGFRRRADLTRLALQGS